MGEIVTDCKSIWNIYLKDNFMKDLVTIVLVALQTSGVDQHLSSAGVPVILRMIVVLMIFQRLKEGASKV